MTNENSGAVVHAGHLKNCVKADAAIVVDGNGDDVVTTLLREGWTWDGNTETVAGKRIRNLVPPAHLSAALKNSAAGNVTDLGDFTRYADDDIDGDPKESAR